ncbi:MAG: ABC transporter permease [Defluviitaleaceae bacterium]|nr:ABC transporter permease [Defluviitaleaceae bacterium]MCL2275085.1 ABC transporter permease [Defluviitaleaceae bacterium]
MTIFKYALKRALMKPATLVSNCVLPLVFIILMRDGFNMDGGRGFSMLAFLLMFGAFMMAGSIQADKLDGVTIRILAGPITFRTYLMQNFFAGLVPTVVLLLIIGGIGMGLHGWTLPFAGAVIICFTLLSATMIGLSFVWAVLFKDKEASLVAFTLIVMLMGMLGGLMIPMSTMPAVLRNIGAIFPPHWAARGLEELVTYGTFTTQYWVSMAALVLFAVVLLLYGSKRRIA